MLRPMHTLEEIQVAVRERLEVVRAAKDEYDRLERALEALGPIADEPPHPKPHRGRVRTPEAPYGFKADGTPRKRPGRRKSEEVPPDGKPEGAVLRITTGSVPPVKGDAVPAYVTQEG